MRPGHLPVIIGKGRHPAIRGGAGRPGGRAVEERIEAIGGGFTVLDGAALVVGAAVASVHIRSAVPADGLNGLGWAMLWMPLAGVALTAAGPFVFLVRRYGRRPIGYPAVGDRLWCLLGLPWLLTA